MANEYWPSGYWPEYWSEYWPSGTYYTFDLHLTNTTGVDIEAATILLETSGSVEIFSVLTAATGKIVQQSVAEQSGSELTITKAGYNTYAAVIDVDSNLDLEIALSTGGGGGVSPTQYGLVPLGVKQGVV